MTTTINPYFYDPNIQEYANPSAFEKIEQILNAPLDLQKNPKILPLVKVIKEKQAVEIPLFLQMTIKHDG